MGGSGAVAENNKALVLNTVAMFMHMGLFRKIPGKGTWG